MKTEREVWVGGCYSPIPGSAQRKWTKTPSFQLIPREGKSWVQLYKGLPDELLQSHLLKCTEGIRPTLDTQGLQKNKENVGLA